MGGEGSMMSMINSLKNNKAMRNERKHLTDSSYNLTGKTELEFVKKSDEELQEIRQKIKLKAKQQHRKMMIIYFVVVFIVLFGIYIMLRNWLCIIGKTKSTNFQKEKYIF